MHARVRSRPIVAVLLLAAVAACSAGDDAGSDQPDTTVASPDAAGDPADESPTSTVPDTTAAPATTPPSTAATSTTVPPPEVLPVGAVWQQSTLAMVAGTPLSLPGIVTVNDEIWALGQRANAPTVWRSTDGVEWTEGLVAPPPSSGALSISGVASTDAGHLAWGSRATSCSANVDLGDGFREVGLCDEFSPVFYLSTDGTTWEVVEPALGSGTIVLDDVTAVADGFVAVGTARGPDWHGRVWSSPDGRTWELVTELRGVDGPMSGHEVHWDGSTLVLLAHEHPCSQDSINFNTPGWILGAQWAEHLRMWSGPDVTSLVPIAPDEHPILQPPLPVDCSIDSGYDLAGVPYADASGEVIGGRVVLQDLTPVPEPEPSDDAEADDESEPEPDPYRLVTLDGDAWTVTTSDGVDRRRGFMIDLDGRPAFVEWGQDGRARLTMSIVASDDDGRWSTTVAQRPSIAELPTSAVVGADGTVFVVARLAGDPFETFRTSGDPAEIVVLRSADWTEDELVDCVPSAGGSCLGANFAALDGYPDLTGADFSGASLRFADLGSGDYRGVSFGGSNLLGAVSGESDEAARFDGADFSGATLRGAELEDLAGANLAGADLRDASLSFSSLPASLEGAILTGAELEVVRGPDGEVATLELSLAGLDLTRTDINGAFGTDVRLVITDLRGAVLDRTSFYQVDLSGVLLDDGVLLEGVDVWDNSLCPDGEPPTDGPIGTCVRAAAEE